MPRRQLLAGLVGATSVATAGLVLTTDRSRAFTDTAPIQTENVDGLVVDWRETYNGATLVDASDGAASRSPTGPAISLGNVLPGDSGTLSVRLRLEGADDLAVEPSVAVDLRGEPNSPGLQEFIEAAVWYDVGLLGVDPLGANNGERDFGETLVDPAAEGTVEDVAAALEDGVSLGSSPNPLGSNCLDVGDEGGVTITFGWSFPPNQPNINAVQGDSLEFDLTFDATQC